MPEPNSATDGLSKGRSGVTVSKLASFVFDEVDALADRVRTNAFQAL